MIVPTCGRVVLKKIKEEETKSKTGSLILPNTQPKQDRYSVVASYAPCFPEGVIVYVEKYKGVEIEKDGTVYLVIAEEDIVATDTEDSLDVCEKNSKKAFPRSFD